MTQPKSLLHMRNELAHRFCETVPLGQDRHMLAVQFGFDAGTKAVIERASVLVDALENAAQVERSLRVYLGYLTAEKFEDLHGIGLGTKEALAEWENFTKGDAE